MDSVRHVHGHGGATRVEWLDSSDWVDGLDADLAGVRCRATNVAQDLCEQVDHGLYVRDLEASQADVGWLLEEVARLRQAALAGRLAPDQATALVDAVRQALAPVGAERRIGFT
jgi:hypothetical protein